MDQVESKLVPISATRLREATKKIGKKRLTQREIKVFQFLSQGMSKRQAMIKAGYAIQTADKQSKRFMERPIIKAVLMDIVDELEEVGINKGFIATKFKEWMTAEKIHGSLTEPDRLVPDYQTQLKAFAEYKDLVKYEETKNKPEQGVKRKITLEEFWDEEQKELE
jgi:phage terminase small subunit